MKLNLFDRMKWNSKIFMQPYKTAHFNLKIRRLRCDNGKYYVTREIKEFFQPSDIQFEFIIR